MLSCPTLIGSHQITLCLIWPFPHSFLILLLLLFSLHQGQHDSTVSLCLGRGLSRTSRSPARRLLQHTRGLTGRLLAYIHKITGQFWGPQEASGPTPTSGRVNHEVRTGCSGLCPVGSQKDGDGTDPQDTPPLPQHPPGEALPHPSPISPIAYCMSSIKNTLSGQCCPIRFIEWDPCPV